MKRIINRAKTGIRYAGTLAASMVFLMPSVTAYAAEGQQAVNGINTLVTMASNIVSAIGAFVTLWGIFEMGNAMQERDPAQQGQAGKRIAGGIVMVAAPQLLKLFI